MKGWKFDSHRHSLARKGIKTKDYWRKEHPELVKNFPGENPRITENFIRFRQQNPIKFSQFRTKVVEPGKQVVLGKNKKTGEYELQSVLISKNPVKRDSMAYRVFQDGQPIGNIKDITKYRNMPGYNPKAIETVVYDDDGNVAIQVWNSEGDL